MNSVLVKCYLFEATAQPDERGRVVIDVAPQVEAHHENSHVLRAEWSVFGFDREEVAGAVVEEGEHSAAVLEESALCGEKLSSADDGFSGSQNYGGSRIPPGVPQPLLEHSMTEDSFCGFRLSKIGGNVHAEG